VPSSRRTTSIRWLQALQPEAPCGSVDGRDDNRIVAIRVSTWVITPFVVLLRIAVTETRQRTMSERRARSVSITNTSMICPTKGNQSMTPAGIKNQDRNAIAHVRIAVLKPADSEALLGLLARCSPTALYRRFHGVTNGLFYAQQIVAASKGRNSYVAWIGKECVGLGNLHVRDDTADIGVLVEDDWQRRGVGTALLLALVRRVRESGSCFLRADVLEENRFLLPLLARLGPAKTSVSAGSYTTLVDVVAGTTLHKNPSRTTGTGHSHPSSQTRRCVAGLAQ
jgi:GNAT superfamily N-acetyltransferase